MNCTHGVRVFEVESPLGTLRGAATERGLALLAFPGGDWAAPLARLVEDAGPARAAPRHTAARELRAYFAGRLREFTVPVDLRFARGFHRSVLERLLRVPFGELVTYGDLARAAGSPRAARAAGRAVGSNPVPIVVPCHRVVAAGGRLGGFGAGLPAKRWLLRHEGVHHGGVGDHGGAGSAQDAVPLRGASAHATAAPASGKAGRTPSPRCPAW